MLSQTVEYALRAMVQLTYMAPTACSTDVLAETTQVPRAYLSKVLQALRRAGIVQLQRGVGGGVCLGKPAEQVTILEVVNAVDPLRRISTCPLGLASHGKRLCPLHKKLDLAFETVEKSFAETTLAEIVNLPHGGSKPLCAEVQTE